MDFPHVQHHIVFVSKQTLPAVLGASIPGAEPVCVHGIVTPEMQQSSQILRTTLEQRGRRYKEHRVRSKDQQTLFAVLDTIQQECADQTLSLNLTGGTKLMTLAAAEWAYACEQPSFYVDTANDKLVLLGTHWEYHPLPDLLNFKNLLASYGYTVKSCVQDSVPPQRRETLEAIVKLVCTSKGGRRAMHSLNACAQRAGERNMLVEDNELSPSPQWLTLLELCQREGMVQTGNNHLYFPSEAARSWCCGLWLEEYVQMILYKLHHSQQIRSWASSVQVQKDGTPNELDALFTARNRLFTIECKTVKMTGNNNIHQEKTNDILYKADSLHERLGGVFAESMVCSVDNLPPHELNRANDMNIRVVQGNDLLQLENTLLRWIASI